MPSSFVRMFAKTLL